MLSHIEINQQRTLKQKKHFLYTEKALTFARLNYREQIVMAEI